ncbi:MAG: hypothetical protein ACRENG_00430 [bacterium]
MQIDYDIHGLVGIRLVDPSTSDAAAVAKQLGPLQCPLEREPDIIVRFVKQLPTPALCHVALGNNGFTEDGFFILRSKKKAAKVKIAFDQIGKRCEIVCETGLAAVPLLMALLNLTALKKGYVALHASAFVHNGTGVLVTGWAKGGKTEALLAFAAQGAQYVGDEWILLGGDGEKMCGVPENIRLWDWHLGYLPHLRGEMKRETRWLFKAIHWLDKLQQQTANAGLGKIFPMKMLREALPALKRQLNVAVKPQTIFGDKCGPFAARPEKVFLMMGHDAPDIEVQPIDPFVIARRMLASIHYEQLPFVEHYLAFKFAFPDHKNEFIEHAHLLQTGILCRALLGKEAYVVRHPYPVSLPALYESMRPYCETPVKRSPHSRNSNRQSNFSHLHHGTNTNTEVTYEEITSDHLCSEIDKKF